MKHTDVLLLATIATTDNIRNIASHFHVMLVDYTPQKKSQTTTTNNNSDDYSMSMWILLRDYLRIRGHVLRAQYQFVMLIHAVDAAIVGDPFPYYYEKYNNASLLVFTESIFTVDSALKISSCFNPKIAAAIQLFPHIYSGIVMGTFDGLFSLSKQIVHFLTEPSDIGAHVHDAGCSASAREEAIVSVLVYLGLVDDVITLAEDMFPVVNLPGSFASMSISPLVLPVSQIVRWHHPDIPISMLSTVLLGYRAFPSIATPLLVKYVYWVDYSDVVAMWRKDTSCDKYSVWTGSDIFVGVNDLDSIVVSTPNECCSYCNQGRFINHMIETCTVFVYSGGTCYFKKCDVVTITDKVSVVGDEKTRRASDWSKKGKQTKVKSDVIISAYIQ